MLLSAWHSRENAASFVAGCDLVDLRLRDLQFVLREKSLREGKLGRLRELLFSPRSSSWGGLWTDHRSLSSPMEFPPVSASTLCLLFCLSSGKGKEPWVPHQSPFSPNPREVALIRPALCFSWGESKSVSAREEVGRIVGSQHPTPRTLSIDCTTLGLAAWLAGAADLRRSRVLGR